MSNTKKIEIEIEVPELEVNRTKFGRYKFIYNKETNEVYVSLMLSEFSPLIDYNREMLGYCYMNEDEDGVESFSNEIADLMELQDILRAGGICNG